MNFHNITIFRADVVTISKGSAGDDEWMTITLKSDDGSESRITLHGTPKLVDHYNDETVIEGISYG